MSNEKSEHSMTRFPFLTTLLLAFSLVAIPATATWPTNPNLLDINTATAAQLAALPGMGPVYAQRIIEGRPYTAKNQILNRGILPQPAYDKIAALIIAHRPPKKP